VTYYKITDKRSGRVVYTGDPRVVAHYRTRRGHTIEQTTAPLDIRRAIAADAAAGHPGDHLAPVNAGQANPHGPAVVSVELDGRHSELIPPAQRQPGTKPYTQR
jgi:hypothetical protein